jgi:solute carrier family 26, other
VNFLIFKIIWSITFASVIILDVDIGLLIGLSISIIFIVVKDQMLSIQIKTKPTEDINMNNKDNEIIRLLNYTNCIVLKPEHSIYFANCESFKERIHKIYKIKNENKNKDQTNGKNSVEMTNKTPLIKTNEVSISDDDLFIIMDFSAVNYIDTNGVNTVFELIHDFKKKFYIFNAQGNIFYFSFVLF